MKAGKRDPHDHVALNVALYGPRGRRWAMTERGRPALAQGEDHLVIGPSAVRWDGSCLVFDIHERGAVLGERVEGQVRVWPEALVASGGFDLDPQGRHRWCPIATRARVELGFARPSLRWSGDAYVDSNFGSEPMEARFRDWQWARAHVGDASAVFYEGERRDGSRFALALGFDRTGHATPIEQPALVRLPRTRWAMPRATRSDGAARVVRTWEDTPFYARSALGLELQGRPVLAVHESLSLTRFIHPAVQWMIGWRMPRHRS